MSYHLYFPSTLQPKNMMVNEGDTIKLPCVVDRLDNFVIMWKKVNYHIIGTLVVQQKGQ